MQWGDFSQVNLRRAYDEREASQRLRGVIASTLSRTSADMREQADRVEEALSRRVAETEEAVRHLEVELKEVKHVTSTEKNSFSLVQSNFLYARPAVLN